MKLDPILLEGLTFPAKIILYTPPLGKRSGPSVKRQVDGILNNQRIPVTGSDHCFSEGGEERELG